MNIVKIIEKPLELWSTWHWKPGKKQHGWKKHKNKWHVIKDIIEWKIDEIKTNHADSLDPKRK